MVKKDKKKIRKEKKRSLYNTIVEKVSTFNKIIFLGSDNVGSTQFHEIRKEFRKINTEVLNGKKTMFRSAINAAMKKPDFKAPQSLKLMLDSLNGPYSLIFTNEDISKIDEILKKYNRRKPARAHTTAPASVILPKGPTGMDPKQTSIFQAMKIPTKINKQQVDITEDVTLIKQGTKIGESEAALLEKLGIKPFVYQFEIIKIFENGITYGPEVLKLTNEEILKKVANGIRNLSAASITLGYPTSVTAPQMLMKGFKNLLAVTMGTPYTFKIAEMLKQKAIEVTKVPEAKKEEEVKKEEAKKEDAPVDEPVTGMAGMFGDD